MAGKQQKTAGNRKKSNSGRKTTTRKKTSEKNNKQSIELIPEEREQQQGIHDEIVVIAILALSILLILSNFNLCGRLGVLISNITYNYVGFIHSSTFMRPCVHCLTAFAMTGTTLNPYTITVAGALYFCIF